MNNNLQNRSASVIYKTTDSKDIKEVIENKLKPQPGKLIRPGTNYESPYKLGNNSTFS